jgi:hypothetical protein
MLKKERQDFTGKDGAVEIATMLAPLSVAAIALAYSGSPIA